jgi:hypothetical protein
MLQVSRVIPRRFCDSSYPARCAPIVSFAKARAVSTLPGRIGNAPLKTAIVPTTLCDAANLTWQSDADNGEIEQGGPEASSF